MEDPASPSRAFVLGSLHHQGPLPAPGTLPAPVVSVLGGAQAVHGSGADATLTEKS